ncbi:MAG TPA: hypothetical protein DCQ28_04760 [Bacteroidetes bacterium]|nr:hypothetical protein [Bacteroidota bacterium]
MYNETNIKKWINDYVVLILVHDKYILAQLRNRSKGVLRAGSEFTDELRIIYFFKIFFELQYKKL